MIEVKGLSKVYPGCTVKAVDSVSFDLADGEIGCLIGTSGCGKTTTLKMINRLIEPTEGDIWVGDQYFKKEAAVNWRRKIGYIIQKAGLLPHMTVFENIALLPTLLKRDKEITAKKVEELLDLVNMPYQKYKNIYPRELSGGQQQRIGIARSLVENPPVMLMDEPFGALDPITKVSLHDEFIGMNKRLKKTILMVTHDMNEAFKLGDKIILMDKGKIVQIGTKDDFTNNPANQFVRDFVKGTFRE